MPTRVMLLLLVSAGFVQIWSSDQTLPAKKSQAVARVNSHHTKVPPQRKILADASQPEEISTVADTVSIDVHEARLPCRSAQMISRAVEQYLKSCTTTITQAISPEWRPSPQVWQMATAVEAYQITAIPQPAAVTQQVVNIPPQLPPGITPGKYRVVDNHGKVETVQLTRSILQEMGFNANARDRDFYVVDNDDRRLYFIRMEGHVGDIATTNIPAEGAPATR